MREDQKRRSQQKLEDLLLEGLRSGDPRAITPEYLEKKRQQLMKRHAKKTGKR